MSIEWTAIIRDGLAVEVTTDPLAWMHRTHSFSLSYALEHGGYRLEERDAPVRGWRAFQLIAGRSGHGVNGYVVRTLLELNALAFTDDADTRTGDYFLAERVIAPALSGIIAALDYLTGDLAIIAGELDTAARMIGAAFNLDADEL